MATKKKPAEAQEGMVWALLTQTHDLPGMKLVPGRVRVSPALRDELKVAGKIVEQE
ncbi:MULTISPECIES: hypothetical protein [unclassified Shinella]|uniref:hypothetical protein n=1 Tax=unclassified Shinella TaxID=2643062 RepID=UPI00234F7D99|nr:MULTISPECIES: hypothetical protein [unclassified Shinella]MCO5153385.1 hypothetical protein [Shinella sp.]MDC7260564.1 hypothetical protein [Shinella sp. HY16]MDC7267459.1 hypothetical protein [Shinella sp. YZ44]